MTLEEMTPPLSWSYDGIHVLLGSVQGNAETPMIVGRIKRRVPHWTRVGSLNQVASASTISTGASVDEALRTYQHENEGFVQGILRVLEVIRYPN